MTEIKPDSRDLIQIDAGELVADDIGIAEAIAAWNARAERTCHMITDEGAQNWHSCSVCDADYYTDQKINYCPNCGALIEKGDA